MKLINSTAIGIIFGCLVACSNQTIDNGSSSVKPSTSVTVASKVEKGQFVSLEHETKGTTQIIKKQDSRNYVVFSKDFRSTNGPDLYVILYRGETPSKNGIKEGDYVSLKKLEKVQGEQEYVIDKNIAIEDFKSIAIWCKKFNVTFGYAKIN